MNKQTQQTYIFKIYKIFNVSYFGLKKGKFCAHETSFQMQYFLFSLLRPGFLPEPVLSSALKDRDLFDEPPSTSSAASSAASHSLSVTPPSDSPSPIAAVFGSGSSMVTTVMNEHPPTLPPASTKPQVTPAKPKCLLKAASVVPQCGSSVQGKQTENGPHYCRYAAANLIAHLRNDILYSENLRVLLLKNILQQAKPTGSWSQ